MDHRPAATSARRTVCAWLGVAAAACTLASSPAGAQPLADPPQKIEPQTIEEVREQLDVPLRLDRPSPLVGQLGLPFALLAPDTSVIGWSSRLDGRFYRLSERLQDGTLSVERMRRLDRRTRSWQEFMRYAGPLVGAADELMVVWDLVDEDGDPSRATLRWAPRLVGAGATLEVHF